MRKLIIMLALCLFMVSTCYSQTEITIITDEWAPYEFKIGTEGNESITGFSTEVILSVLEQMGVKIKGKIRQYPWARCEVMIINGSADLLFTAASSPDREAKTYYCYEPLITGSWSFFIRKADEGKLKFDTLDDLKGQKIGVVRAFSYTPEFWEYVNKNSFPEEVVSDDLNLKKLNGNRFNYTIMNSLNGRYLIKQLGFKDDIIMLPKPLDSSDLFCVFSKNTINIDFVNEFAAALKRFKNTDLYTAIYTKYF